MSSGLRRDLERTQIMLDKLPPRSVVLDQDGDAWQYGGIYWYGAFESEPWSSFNLAQLAPIKVIYEGGTK